MLSIIVFVFYVICIANKTELITPKAISVGDIESIDVLTIDDIYMLNDGDVDIIYEYGTQIPIEMKCKFTTNKILNQQDAVVALMGLRELMSISEYDFYCDSVYEGGTEGNEVTTYVLIQLHNGVPVDTAGFRVTASKNGEPISVQGIFMEVVNDIETDPIISYKDGLNLVNPESGTYTKSAQLVIFGLDENNPSLCWKYETGAKLITKEDDVYYINDDNSITLYDKIVHIDAITGELVIEFPIMTNCFD